MISIIKRQLKRDAYHCLYGGKLSWYRRAPAKWWIEKKRKQLVKKGFEMFKEEFKGGER